MNENATNAIDLVGGFLKTIWDNLSSLDFFGLGFTYASLIKYLFIFSICFMALLGYIHFRVGGDITTGLRKAQNTVNSKIKD